MLMPTASAVEIIVNASYDGSVGSNDNTTWFNMRNNPYGDSVLELWPEVYSGMTESTNFTDDYLDHWRGLVTWDTSAIPDDAIISSAIVSVYGRSKHNSLGDVDFSIIEAHPSDKRAYVELDYHKTTFIRMASDIPYVSFDNEGWNELTLNPSGLTTISKTGLTTFMFTHSADVDNSSLTWVIGPDDEGDEPASGFCFVGVNDTTRDFKPFITINYNLPVVTPVASFTSNVTSGTTPLTVKFTDTSTNSPTSWNWSFGDGTWFNTTAAGNRNATHAYTNPTTYTVRLTVANEGGSSTTSPGTTITVNAVPTLTMDKIGIYKGGAWYLDNDGSGTWNTGDRANVFGSPGWTSVLGDWNGDGKSEIGIYKDGCWYLDYNGNGIWDAGIDKLDYFGTLGYTPVVGNWNGDATGDKIGIFKDGIWYLDNDGSGTWNTGDRANVFGSAGWTPVLRQLEWQCDRDQDRDLQGWVLVPGLQRQRNLGRRH